MIRRNLPRGDAPTHWLLIPQVEHARISHQLAAAWSDLLPGAPERVRDELLAAILHHDDGWIPWDAAPKFDPEHGRPYSFTEMRPADAQALWLASIDACREIGPLAGWVVASHFIQMQGKPDEDLIDWARWLGKQDRRRTDWLSEWQAASASHTRELADRCLYLLQQFDWLSLWLGCVAALDDRDPQETLDFGDADRGLGPVHLTPTYAVGEITVAPWPFDSQTIEVIASAERIVVGRYASVEEWSADATKLRWKLQRAGRR